MEPFSAPAEDVLGATRMGGIPGLPGGDFDVLRSGAIERGPEKADTGRAAIVPRPRDERTPCRQLGFCFRGRKKGRQVVRDLLRAAPRATATGHLDLRPEAAALRILHGDSDRVPGVLCADRDGEQRAGAAAVAGNSTESPRRLLDSASSMVPDGLVKASGLGVTPRHASRHAEADARPFPIIVVPSPSSSVSPQRSPGPRRSPGRAGGRRQVAGGSNDR